MVGFFSSSALATLAPGLATYLAGSHSAFQLVISPFLSATDRKALEGGCDEAEVARAALEQLVITEDLLQRHTLTCLAHLLRTGRIEIRIALMRDALFHPKVWLFSDDGGVMAATAQAI